MTKIEITTDRLIIKDHSTDDLSEYHKLISNPNNMFFIPDLMSESIEDTRTSLNQIIEDSMNIYRKMYYFGIFLKDSTYVGEIGYSVDSIDISNNKKVNLGYFINDFFWNQGITTEAVNAIIDFAFTKNKVLKIESGCIPENVASEKIMIKCGFKKEAYKKNHSWVNSKWMDRVEYGMTKEEYFRHRAGNSE